MCSHFYGNLKCPKECSSNKIPSSVFCVFANIIVSLLLPSLGIWPGQNAKLESNGLPNFGQAGT